MEYVLWGSHPDYGDREIKLASAESVRSLRGEQKYREAHGFKTSIRPAAVTAPPIAGAADLERESKLDAERVSAEWRTRSARVLADVSEGPLFGGPKQGGLF